MKTIITCILVFLLPYNICFAAFGSHPKIDVKHIEKDLINKSVEGWTIAKTEPKRIKILDAKYDKNTAIVYIHLNITSVSDRYGGKGRLRLYYEFAADDWNLLNVKAISFSKLDLLKDTQVFLSAAAQGDLPLIKEKLDKGVNINAKEKAKDIHVGTALHLAVHFGHVDVVKFLLENGADIGKKNNHGASAIDLAGLSPSSTTFEMHKLLGAAQDKANPELKEARLVMQNFWDLLIAKKFVEAYKLTGTKYRKDYSLNKFVKEVSLTPLPFIKVETLSAVYLVDDKTKCRVYARVIDNQKNRKLWLGGLTKIDGKWKWKRD